MSLLGDALRRKRKEAEQKAPEPEPEARKTISLPTSRPSKSVELKKSAAIKPAKEEPDLRDPSERPISWREEANDNSDDQPAAPPPPKPKPAAPAKPKVIGVSSGQRLAVQKDPSRDAPPPKKKRREWVAAFVVFLCLLLLVSIGGVIYHLVLYREDAVDKMVQLVFPAAETTDRSAETVEAEPRERTSRAARLIDTATQATDQAAERARETDEALGVTAAPARTASAPTEPAPTPPPDAPVAPEREPRVTTPTATDQEDTVTAVAAEPEVITWPELRVQAAMGSGRSGSALINGQLIDMGDEFQGVQVVEITRRGVLMRFHDQERVIPVRR